MKCEKAVISGQHKIFSKLPNVQEEQRPKRYITVSAPYRPIIVA